jgi:tetratricopeptide (TPR) repeat protein
VGKDRYAITYHTKALNIACQIDSQTGQEQQLRLLGITYYDLGQLDRSLEYHRKALSIARKIGVQKRVGLHLGDLGGVFRRLGKIERGINFHNKAAHIAHDVGSLDEEGLWLYNKGLDYLMLGKIEQAINMFNNSYQIGDKTKDPQLKIASLLRLGIAFLITHDSTAKDVFEDAGNRCREILSHITSFFEPNYALALALIGKSACDPRWQDEGARTKLLVQALTHYQHALEITAAPGIVQDAIRDLELIQAAGVKGLEPVFELLESAEYKPDIPENLPDLESLIVS